MREVHEKQGKREILQGILGILMTPFWKNHRFIGLAMLAVQFILGVITLYWGTHVDEADNLVVGNLIFRGATLYKEVFSHHFPFPYIWMSAVVALAGKSIIAARLSVLIFHTVGFAIAMLASRKYLLTGITALLWGIVRPFYLGHMVLYTSFAGVALFVVLVVTLAILDDTVKPSWTQWITLAFFSWIAFLAGPLSAYAIFTSLVFLLLKHPASGLKTGLLLLAGLLPTLTLFILTDTLQPFWENAILFNANVYNAYTDANPVRITDWLVQVLSGLGIPFGQWFRFDPLKPIEFGYSLIDAWLFTGFLYRLGLVTASFLYILHKKYSTGAYLYLFAAATLLIARAHFRSQAFILAALTALAVLVVEQVRWAEVRPLLASLARGLRLVTLVMAFWLGIRLSGQIILERQNLTYDANFRKLERAGDRLDRLACGMENVHLADYPEGMYSYWFSDLAPVSKYIFMWPWVAEIGQQEMIRELQEQPLAIVVVTDEVVWDAYPTLEYLAPLVEYLDANYHKVSKDTYISPALFESCPP